jgi:hypothetical protein
MHLTCFILIGFMPDLARKLGDVLLRAINDTVFSDRKYLDVAYRARARIANSSQEPDVLVLETIKAVEAELAAA